MSDIVVDLDAFGTTLEGLLDRLGVSVEEEIKPAVTKAAQTARKEWKANADAAFKPMSGEHRYGASISYTVKGSGHETHAEIGSKKYPGLPHLLEKGHATIGGGYVAGRKHIEPAYQTAANDYESDVNKAVDSALGSL